jgi:riboflavin synthase
MFTGIVEGQGTVQSLRPEGPGIVLAIAPPPAMCSESEEVHVGDSIAINGCCLTISALRDGYWLFQAGTETLSRTSLGGLKAGDAVNLERSLLANGRLGGHFVQGHIDGLGHVDAVHRDGEWTTMWFRVPERLTRQMVEKGSVAVDGVSLTLVRVETDRFSVALIPHTLTVTTLARRQIGDPVNIETDIIGKYLEKLLGDLSLKPAPQAADLRPQ